MGLILKRSIKNGECKSLSLNSSARREVRPCGLPELEQLSRLRLVPDELYPANAIVAPFLHFLLLSLIPSLTTGQEHTHRILRDALLEMTVSAVYHTLCNDFCTLNMHRELSWGRNI